MSLLLLASALLGGTLFTWLFDHEAPLPLRLCAGACVGLATVGLLGFILACGLGLGDRVVLLSALGALWPALLLARGGRWRLVTTELAGAGRSLRAALARPRLGLLLLATFYAASGWALWRLYDRALVVERDGLYTGVDHNIGDLPFHVGIVMSFVRGQNFPPEHPELAGARLSYPFLADFVAALMMQGGLGLRDAFFLESVVLALALLGLLHRWAGLLTSDTLAAALTPGLVLLSGGLGFWLLGRDVDPLAGGLWGLLPQLPRDYTIQPTGPLRWGNALTTLLLPQRSFLLGLPLFILLWTWWWQAVAEVGARESLRRMTGAGLVAGLLPLAHAHSFAVALAMGACLALLFRRRSWAAFFAAALALAVPQVVFMAWDSPLRGSEFVAWQPGWDRGESNALWFWFVNTGLFIPLLALALIGRRRLPPRLLRFWLPFTLCFLVPNLFRLSPWIWDNMKILFYWYVASVPLVALLLARLARAGGLRRTAALILLVTLVLAGGLDVWRVASRAVHHRVADADTLAFGARIAEATPPRAVILHAPTHNSPVLFAGRRSVLGYAGHIWSQGMEAGAREEEVRDFYQGAPGAQALLVRYGVDYVLIGPDERRSAPGCDGRLADFPVVLEKPPYRLLRAGRP